jgi:predicted anti-sigma-YlaC factor YlaD
MKCSDIRKRISRELDGVLKEEELSAVTGHLEVCDSCREFRAALSRLHALHRNAEEMDPPASLFPSIMFAVEERGQAPARAGGWLRFALPAAAAVVLFLGILAGGNLTELILPSNGADANGVLGLEYLGEHPPGSVGELMLAEAEGGGEDER